MADFMRHFVRQPGGGWMCILEGEFEGPEGRIQVTLGSVFMPGTIFMGVDLSQWLDEQSGRAGGATGVDHRAAVERRMRERGPAVVAERAEHRVLPEDRGRGRVGRAPRRVLDEVEAAGGDLRVQGAAVRRLAAAVHVVRHDGAGDD